MKLPSSLFAVLTLAGTVGAFQGAPKEPLARKKGKDPAIPADVRPGTPLTKADMVAIRSPFWNALGADKSPEAKIDYVVDRDYSVALTLLSVGIWLTLFPPSECGCMLQPFGFFSDLLCYVGDFSNKWNSCAIINRQLNTGDSLFIDYLGGAFHLWFGSFIGYQTMKTRVVFNKETFELKTVTNKILGLQRDKGLKPKEYKNYVLGTNNEW